MRRAAWAATDGNGNGNGHGDGTTGSLHATEIGDAVHRALELVDLAQPTRPADLTELVRAWYPAIIDAEQAYVSRLVDAYCGSSLARRIAGLDGVRVERPFAFELEGVLLNGRLDVLWRSGAEALVVDYKTNVLGGRDLEEIVDDEYRSQRIVYALACLGQAPSASRSSTSSSRRRRRSSRRASRVTDLDALETELGEAIARIREGDFRPTPSPYACSGCPALDRLRGPGLGGARDEQPLPELTSAG